ncbi:hypothetical protein Rhopal_001213-T1 [Rhodotorula paludigena]|uniref:Major facilitator superfamily (MFS) profile domain-containing protein n=1 Tax=Rhodotorula paludigena TaxID=86838 RepID=A0AAV5GD74_9BASI|nr:hypothetical protein Rhopal_001213-T1 [Rhodotorula paludigena]
MSSLSHAQAGAAADNAAVFPTPPTPRSQGSPSLVDTARKESYAQDAESVAADSAADGFTWTEDEERRMVRRTDRHLMPLLWVLFMLSFLDRSNAKTAGMVRDLNMSDDQYQWLLTIFYIGYVCGQPSMLLWKVVPPHVLVTVLTLCWGSFALLQAAAKWEGLMVLRLLLGFAETAFAPGVTFYLSFFYNRREIGFRQGLYFGAAAIASCYAGALAYGISHIQHAAVPSWKLLFLIEGAPAVPMALVAWFFLPDRASKAQFLSDREREIARRRTDRSGKSGREGGLKLSKVGEGLRDPKAYITALIYFSANVSYSSLPVFLPTILEEMGFSSIRAQGLSAPPYLASFFVIVSVCFITDRIGDRTIFIIPLALLGGAGYLILALATLTGVRYFAIFLCATGIFPVIGLTLPLTASLTPDDSKRGASFLLLNLLGQCGPFLGTRLYPADEGPYYVKGMSIACAFMFFVALLALALRLLLIRENRRRDALYGYVNPKAQDSYGAGQEAASPKAVNAAEEAVGRGDESDEAAERTWRYLL